MTIFGYVRPVRNLLSQEENELYRAVYCGLCRTMRKRCGWIAPFFLNFDFTFLAMLLTARENTISTECRRCHIPPFKKRCMRSCSPSLELAADESVILAYWKLRDRIDDSGFISGLPARLISGLFHGTYCAAKKRYAQFDRSVQEQLSCLRQLEQERCASIDRAADTFAKLLCAAVPATGCEAEDRATQQLLYHLGRWIYLIDARDDLSQDIKIGNYNPIALRFQHNEADGPLSVTLDHSVNMMRTASALMEFGPYTTLVDNILDYGIPTIQKAVFNGQWSEMKKQKIWRTRHE